MGAVFNGVCGLFCGIVFLVWAVEAPGFAFGATALVIGMWLWYKQATWKDGQRAAQAAEKARQDRATAARADKQHKAILDGDLTAGYYGDYRAEIPVAFIDGLDETGKKNKGTTRRSNPQGK